MTAKKKHDEAEPEESPAEVLADFPSAATVAPPATPQEVARSQGREWFTSSDDAA